MKSNILASLVFTLIAVGVLSACGTESSDSGLNIVGGSAVTGNEASHQATVALVDAKSGRSFCSGTLIHAELILTSAHCITEKRIEDFQVRFLGGELIPVNTFRAYKSEQKFGVNFDIAWIRLAAPAKAYAPLEILRDAKAYAKSSETFALGYGQTNSVCEEGDSECLGGKLLKAPLIIKEHVNEGRWFHLALTEAPKGVGPCFGDSGGPLVVRIGGRDFLYGNFVGWDQRLVVEDKSNVCGGGQAIYNVTGAYRDWIETTSGLSLVIDESLNTKGGAVEDVTTIRDPMNFIEWCKSRDEKDSTWYTVQRLISLAGDYALEHGGDIRRVFKDCAYAESNLRSRIKLDKGLILDAYAPDSFGAKARVTDLRPLLSLSNFNVQSLMLSGHAIEDFSPVRALTKLKTLEIVDNQAVVKGTLDVGETFALDRLSLRNSPKAVRLESISSIRNLRYLDLENVRTEGESVIIPGDKLLQLTVKADVDLELPESMPVLQTIDLSGLKSFVMAKRLPKLQSFKMEDSVQPLRAGSAFLIEEMRDIETFIFRKNRGVTRFALPSTLHKLKVLEVVGSGITDLGDIVGMQKLTKLDFSKNRIEAIPLLDGLPLLSSINISDNPLSDLSPLSRLKSLRAITAENMRSGRLNSLDGLDDLPKLEELRLGKNAFESVGHFLRFEKLQVLVLSYNQISDISKLSLLPDLSYLEVVDNPLNVKTCPLERPEYCRFQWAIEAR